jgi:5-methylcytosine-specific restriction endonuclease McrA
MSKINYIKLFLELAKLDQYNVSRYVCVSEFIDNYNILKLGNGGGWCRLDSKFGKQYKVVTIKGNGKLNFSWDEDDMKIIEEEIKEKIKKKELEINKGNMIKYIKICGMNDINTNRHISKKVRDHYENRNCVVCGSYNNIVIDHKNDLYNDMRVLNTKTQTIDDFQPLCNHCNLQKRQISKKIKETGKRYSALNIPMVAMFNIPFTEGDETYDIKDINWGRGSFWYDPVDFINKCRMKELEISFNNLKI